MADNALEALRDAFANAPAGPVLLGEAFWQGAGLLAPPGFDAAIRAAYRLPVDQPGLEIRYARDAVSVLANASFQIDGVALAFLDAPAISDATLYGMTGSATTPRIGIDVAPSGWQLSDQFPAMTGGPFTALQFDQQRFYFASEQQAHATLSMAAGQNLYGLLQPPPQLAALVGLLANLPMPSVLRMCGPIVLDLVDNQTILLPDMNLSMALVAGNDLELFFLAIDSVRVGFLIATTEASIEDEDGASTTVYFQNPSLFLEAALQVEGADNTKLGLALRSQLNNNRASYSFSVAALAGTPPVTPAAITALMLGSSYFSLVPAVLQSYLSVVQFQGFTIAGPLRPTPAIGSLSAVFSSTGAPLVLLTDPANNQAFSIDSFALSWRMLYPNDKLRRTNLASFDATMTLFPSVFRTKDGAEGGLFQVHIDQSLDLSGSFNGSVAFSDVLRAISGGAIGLPEGVNVSFSDVTLAVQPSQKSYAFGFTVDADLVVPFITDATQPLIELIGMQFTLAAVTPANRNAATVYTGAVDGQIKVGALLAHVQIAYDGGAAVPAWQLQAALAAPLALSDLLGQFFRAYDLPDFLPGTLVVNDFSVNASIPTSAQHRAAHHPPRGAQRSWRSARRPSLHVHNAQTANPTYQVSCQLLWQITLFGNTPLDVLGNLALSYDAGRTGSPYAGAVIGTVSLPTLGTSVELGYSFGAASDGSGGDSKDLWMSWNGFSARYDLVGETVTFSLAGWTVGGLLTALVETIGDPYFALPEPWDLLNKISLDGLALTFDLSTGAHKSVTACYTLPSPLNLGLLTINSLSFSRIDGKVTLAIDGSTDIPGLQNAPLFAPGGDGQDVQGMPPVPGRGNSYFHVSMLAMGQRIAISAPSTGFDSTKAVIDALVAVPSSAAQAIPFDPAHLAAGQPYYAHDAGWLAALHLGLLQLPTSGNDPATYAIDVMAVFSDPGLYGLRIALSGKKVKVLDGLVIDVLYKKISDTIGCYQIEFALPTALRNLDIGAFSVTLPLIGVQVYTNGDFLIDFGFPYNLDFSRSFTAQGIIMGVPVLGSGGFYFGKLSSATASNLPPTTRGSFHPVIVFGLGVQLGVGKTIDKGILKAGFSITVFGIIEGTLASWHPFDNTNTGRANELQGDYYFALAGTFGIIGKLYGTVDFAIIRADVSLVLQIVARIAYQSFRRIPLSLTASVSVSVSISIDLGLFTIHIDFSFSTSLSVELSVGSDELAPWDTPPAVRLPGRTLHALGISRLPLYLDFSHVPAPGSGALLALTALPQLTILAPEGGGYADQEAALVLVFAIDSPASAGTDTGAASSFGILCAALLPWIMSSVQPLPSVPPLPLAPPGAVSRPLLEAVLGALANPALSPFSTHQLLAFMRASFTVTVDAGDGTLPPVRQDQLNAGSTIFPAFPFLSLTVPSADGDSGAATIAFDNYVMSNANYQGTIRQAFEQVAAKVADEDRAGTAPASADDTWAPLAATVFNDYFVLLSRQLVQSALDAFDDYAYPMTASTSIDSIVAWADGLAPAQLSATALANANLDYPLAPAIDIALEGIAYMVQAGDTLASIAGRYTDHAASPRWQVDPATLILLNATRNNLLQANVKIVLGSACCVTVIGDDFTTVAKRLKMSLAALAQEQALDVLGGLLAPAVVLAIGSDPADDTPALHYLSAFGDTLRSVMTQFHVTLGALLTPANMGLRGLFAIDATLRFAVPGLLILPQDQVWTAIVNTGALRQIAGMAGRYMMHGMRLPLAAGLTLPAGNFLYGSQHWAAPQTAYGVFQLTGQQFPLNTDSLNPTMALSCPATETWLTIGSGSKLDIDISSQATIATAMLARVRVTGYQPLVKRLIAQPGAMPAPRRYGMASWTPCQSADVDALLALTRLPLYAAGAAPAAPQPKPLLWSMSGSLLRAVELQQGAMAAAGFSFRQQRNYLPLLQPFVGTSDPATGTTSFSELEQFAFALRIDFRIKQLAQGADAAPARADANHIVPAGPGNTGSPARALAPFTYEIVGPSPADAVRLERLLTAMSNEGSQIVSKLLLMYPSDQQGLPGLVCRADSEFLSFVVQSNLATETSPPQFAAAQASLAAPSLANGIANSPAEFIKLLWELSTINAGGTYLFYQLLADGTGLPAALFDSSGMATLTLVAALSRDPLRPSDARLFNAVNALLTSDPIDPQHAIVDLAGAPAPVESLPLATGHTLAGLAALYGADLSALVNANLHAPLSLAAAIPLSGLFHQLSPSEAAGADPLGALAGYYSNGALFPITAADLTALNLGVDAVALAVFRIPPLTCIISAGGPVANFAGLAAYYGAEPSALAYLARHIPGLFAGATINIDTVSYDVHPSVGVGNAGLTLARESGVTAAKARPATLARDDSDIDAAMLQLYQLLSAGIDNNAFFSRSADSAAFGPRDPAQQRAAAGPRQLVRAHVKPASSQDYLYEQAIGYGAHATFNAAPRPEWPMLPPASANPYIGIGSILQIRLRWLDLFGNVTPNPFNLPLPADNAPFGSLPVSLRYPDRLIAIDQWPSTSCSYLYTGAAGAPALEIGFRLDTAPYLPATKQGHLHLNAARGTDGRPVWQQNAINDLARFTLIYFQLNQDYTAMGIPGLDGPAVRISVVNSLLATPEQGLPADATRAILYYVNAAIAYLSARAAGEPAVMSALAPISVPFDLAGLAQGRDITLLELSLKLTRDSRLVDPVLCGLNDGLSVSSVIAPATACGGGQSDVRSDAEPVGMLAFAASFENAFIDPAATPNWRLRIGVSAADPGAPSDARASSLWAIRMAEADGPAPAGLRFSVGQAPRFYAPLPIAGALQSLTLKVQGYVSGAAYPSGAPVHTVFTSIDPSAWLAECLEAIDTFLTASYAAPAFVLDRLLGLNEPGVDDGQPGYLGRMLEHKALLAKTIASTATSVYAQDGSALRSAAVDKIEQTLLTRLGNVSLFSCAAVLPVTNARYLPALAPGEHPPRLFGQPVITPTGASAPGANNNFAFSTAKVPLVDATDGNSSMAFMFTSRTAEQDAYVQLQMNYALSYVEYDIHGVNGIDGYQQSRWLRFLTGPYLTPITLAAGAPLVFPVPLRALPIPATVVAQSALPTYATPVSDPSKLKDWTYDFSFLIKQAMQDVVVAQVEFNHPAVQSFAASEASAGDLYAALAQFVAIYPALAQDLDDCLRKIDGNTKAGASDVVTAHYAVAALETVVAAVATTYKAWADVQPGVALAAAPGVAYSFEIALEAGDPDHAQARVHVRPQQFLQGGVPTPNFLPLALVAIDPDHYRPELVSADPGTGEAVYRYCVLDKYAGTLPPVMTLDAARANPQRSVSFAALDLFALQSGWAQIQVVRNRHLAPPGAGPGTNPVFEFATAEARFAAPIVPLLDWPAYRIGQGRTTVQPIADWLHQFFTPLLTPAAGVPYGQSVLVKIETAYRYRLSGSLPFTQIPVSLLSPAATDGATAPAFLDVVAAGAQRWYDTENPLKDMTAAFNFNLMIFSADGNSRLPLLRVDALTLEATNIQEG